MVLLNNYPCADGSSHFIFHVSFLRRAARPSPQRTSTGICWQLFARDGEPISLINYVTYTEGLAMYWSGTSVVVATGDRRMELGSSAVIVRIPRYTTPEMLNFADRCADPSRALMEDVGPVEPEDECHMYTCPPCDIAS